MPESGLFSPAYRRPGLQLLPSMSMNLQPSMIEPLAERVDRVLLRHAELQRTNALLAEQVAALTHERDSLRSRLQAARARVDALIERLPANQEAP